MDEQTMTMDAGGFTEPRRVVEFELRRPHREDITLPTVDMEPVRKAIQQVALTGIGLAIITARSLVRTIRAAHEAGEEAATNPDSIARAIVDLVGDKRSAAEPPSKHRIAVLPIADYDSLSSEEVIARLTTLCRVELDAVRTHEMEHERRTAILKAIDGLEATAR